MSFYLVRLIFVVHGILDWHKLNKSAVFTRQINDILKTAGKKKAVFPWWCGKSLELTLIG